MAITRALLADVVAKETRYKRTLGVTGADAVCRLAPPATPKQLAAVEAHFAAAGTRVPASYRRFLARANGIANFAYEVSLLGSDRLPGPHRHGRMFPELQPLIVGTSSNTLEFIAFDRSTADARGEMELVWVADNGESARCAGFEALLREHVANLEQRLAPKRRPARKPNKTAPKRRRRS